MQSIDNRAIKNLSKKYKFDLLLLDNNVVVQHKNVNITKYYYASQKKEMYYNYYIKSTKPYNKFKILYLVF